jgi:hypothetical protein
MAGLDRFDVLTFITWVGVRSGQSGGLQVCGWRPVDLRTNSGSKSHRATYVRTVKTASGAIAVQIVNASRRNSRSIEHLGSAHDDGELEALKAAARQRLTAGQGGLDLGTQPRGLRPGQHTLTAAEPLPSDLRDALALIKPD